MKRIRSRSPAIAGVAALAVVALTAGTAGAHPVDGTLPGGTSIQVSIDNPTDGAVLPPGPVTVTGTASVGMAEPVANTAVVYVIDLSFSTGEISGCPQAGDNIAACEIEAAVALNDEATAAQTVGAVGAVGFAGTATTTDVQPAAGNQLVTGPAADGDADGVPDVEQVLRSSTIRPPTVTDFTETHMLADGTTHYERAVAAATTVATSPANTMDRTIVAFLSDGEATVGDVGTVLPAVPDTVDFFTFDIGANPDCAGDNDGDPEVDNSLQRIADDTGGACTPVGQIEDLPDILPELIASELTTLTLSVDGDPGTPITNVTPALPQEGPASVTYAVTTDPLPAGIHELCVTAGGSDAGGADSNAVTDCHTVVIFLPGEAFAIEANGLLTVPKTPHATCPPGESLTQAELDVVGLATVTALTAECLVDGDTGGTHASASVDGASLLGGLITITNIDSSCEADAAGVTGTSRVGTINGIPIGTGSGSLTIPLVAQVFFNETTTDAGGRLVQNAIRVQTLLGQEIILAGCRLG